MSKRTDIGRLRYRIKIYEPTRVSDGHGGNRRSDPSEESLIDTVWADVRVANYSEKFKASKLEQVISHSSVIRYKSDLSNLHDHVIEFQGRQMRVVTCVDFDGRKRYLKLTLKEGGVF